MSRSDLAPLPGLEVRSTGCPFFPQGVFTKRGWKRLEPIFSIGRHPVPANFKGRKFQVGPDQFVGNEENIADELNHSCDPNIWVAGTAVLARRDIEIGEELTCDYSLTHTTPKYFFTCKCGSPSCRGGVGGWPTIGPAQQAVYLAEGIVPDYVLNDHRAIAAQLVRLAKAMMTTSHPAR